MNRSISRLSHALLMVFLLMFIAYNAGVDHAINVMHPESSRHDYVLDLIFGTLFLTQLVATLCGWDFVEWLTRRSSGPLRVR